MRPRLRRGLPPSWRPRPFSCNKSGTRSVDCLLLLLLVVLTDVKHAVGQCTNFGASGTVSGVDFTPLPTLDDDGFSRAPCFASATLGSTTCPVGSCQPVADLDLTECAVLADAQANTQHFVFGRFGVGGRTFCLPCTETGASVFFPTAGLAKLTFLSGFLASLGIIGLASSSIDDVLYQLQDPSTAAFQNICGDDGTGSSCGVSSAWTEWDACDGLLDNMERVFVPATDMLPSWPFIASDPAGHSQSCGCCGTESRVNDTWNKTHGFADADAWFPFPLIGEVATIPCNELRCSSLYTDADGNGLCDGSLVSDFSDFAMHGSTPNNDTCRSENTSHACAYALYDVGTGLLEAATDVIGDVLNDVTNVTDILARQAQHIATAESTVAGAYVSGLVSVAVLAAVIPFASSAGAGSATAGGALAGGTVAAGTSVSMVGPAVQAFQHVAVLTHYTKFNLVAPIAIEALGIFDVFNLWMQEASTNSSFHSGDTNYASETTTGAVATTAAPWSSTPTANLSSLPASPMSTRNTSTVAPWTVPDQENGTFPPWTTDPMPTNNVSTASSTSTVPAFENANTLAATYALFSTPGAATTVQANLRDPAAAAGVAANKVAIFSFCANGSGWFESLNSTVLNVTASQGSNLGSQLASATEGQTVALGVHMAISYAFIASAFLAHAVMAAVLKSKCCETQVAKIANDKRRAASERSTAGTDREIGKSRSKPTGMSPSNVTQTCGWKCRLNIARTFDKAPFPRLIIQLIPPLYSAQLAAIMYRVFGIVAVGRSQATSSDDIILIAAYAASGPGIMLLTCFVIVVVQLVHRPVALNIKKNSWQPAKTKWGWDTVVVCGCTITRWAERFDSVFSDFKGPVHARRGCCGTTAGSPKLAAATPRLSEQQLDEKALNSNLGNQGCCFHCQYSPASLVLEVLTMTEAALVTLALLLPYSPQTQLAIPIAIECAMILFLVGFSPLLSVAKTALHVTVRCADVGLLAFLFSYSECSEMSVSTQLVYAVIWSLLPCIFLIVSVYDLVRVMAVAWHKQCTKRKARPQRADVEMAQTNHSKSSREE